MNLNRCRVTDKNLPGKTKKPVNSFEWLLKDVTLSDIIKSYTFLTERRALEIIE